MAQDFWSADLAASNAGQGDKASLERAGKLAAIASSQQGVISSKQSAASSADADRRSRAEFILKYGNAPENIVVPTAQPPGDATLTGDAYLATLDPGTARWVKMLDDGRMKYPNAMSQRNPEMQRKLAAALQYNPDLDAVNAETRFKTRIDFTSGMSSKNLAALNTAMGHLETLRKAAAALNNFQSPKLNEPINRFQEKYLGKAAVNNFNTARDAFATELAKVFKGGGAAPSLSEIEDWKKRADANQSPEQLEGFVTQAADLIGSRINAVGTQYNVGMGKASDPVTLLSPHAQEVYSKLSVPGGSSLSDAGGQAATGNGGQVGGEEVKGWRFTPEQEANINAYAQDPKATPEGYGKLVSGYAVTGGHVAPAQQADYAAANAAAAQDFFRQPAEARAKVASPSYEAIDKAATENAGLGTSVAQTIRNAPESAYNLATGLMAPATDLGRSLASGQRQGIYETIPNLAGDLTGLSDTGTANAFGGVLAEKYGSLSGLKRSAITDPFGTAADVSLPLVAGGSLLARAPGTVGNVGRMAATAGRIIDPVSGLAAAVTQGLPAAVAAIPAGGRRAAGEAATEAAGLSSGVGGATMREAYGAGRGRGLAGAETPQSKAFTGNMREGTSAAGSVVDLARDAVANLRDVASQRYKAAMAQFGQNPVPLNPDDLRLTMAANKPKNFDVMADAPHRPADHVAWQQMNDTVEHYLEKAQQDPSLLEPLAVDQFKQDLYSVGSKIGGATDRDAARIAGGAYRSVRKMLIDHDPVYAETMKDYGDAAQEAASLESGFSLASPRGKPVNVDAASRKLQSIMRNNASTNYGQRAAMGERLAELDPTGTIMPTLAGQSASSWTPRGLRANVEGAGLLGAALHGGVGALASPGLWAGLATTSPRVAGEAAYGAGRATGAAQRVASPILSKLYNAYQNNPSTALALARSSQLSDETERERLFRMYGPEGLSLSGPQ